MYYPVDVDRMLRAEWGVEQAPARPVPPRPRRGRWTYARLWWAARPRSGPAQTRCSKPRWA